VSELVSSLVALFVGVCLIGIVLWLYIFLPAGMATSRNRNAVIWVLISIFGSPILAILLLLALGAAPGTDPA
jgi:hypothetical protein